MKKVLCLTTVFFCMFFECNYFLCYAKIKVRKGDSGGIFYTKDDGNYYALGIAKCFNNSYAAFVKWNNIDDAFGIYFY